jgi:glutamate synthase (NADPH/NADH) small chain
MDCGIPFCNNGCPVNNIIPDWNDLVYRGNWEQALEVLHSTNNFPEFTGRICPAPCEAACTLNINTDPVGIKSIEHAIIDKGWENGLDRAAAGEVRRPARKSPCRFRPAGLAAAQQLARAGHDVTVFEKNDRPAACLRYGIPDFKLDKSHDRRRVKQMQAEGVTFRTGGRRRKDIAGRHRQRRQEVRGCRAAAEEFDAVVLAGGPKCRATCRFPAAN